MNTIQTPYVQLSLDWDDAFDNNESVEKVQTGSISDGLIKSLTTRGKVDIEYISSITGASMPDVINALKGSIYQNPDSWNECFYMGWETAEEYLSGNLRQKLRSARSANWKYNGLFDLNIEAIFKVIPPQVAAKDIYITLGSPWIPTDIIDDFIKYIMRTRKSVSCTCHDNITGIWEIKNKGAFRYHVGATFSYGTPRMNALTILEHTLNMKTICITDEVSSKVTKSGVARVINKEDTLAALEKQKLLISSFQKWVWQDPARCSRLKDIFEEKYSSVVRRHFDGSFLEFPTMNPAVKLYPYQKDAVARILFSPNTLLAHDVGAGKTYVMVAAGMELKRMGLSKKNLFVVPTNLIGQWRSIFLEMYPSANILCVDAKSFTPDKKEKTLAKICDNDYDAIIMTYSCFDRIPLSKEFYLRDLKEKSDKLAQNASTNGTVSKKRNIDKKLGKLAVTKDAAADVICFEDLGITRLFVDEAHNYKNVPVETQVTQVLGIGNNGSKKCRDMLDKVHYVQRMNNGGGVIMATGTPITNSITDVYVMQMYLQSGELALMDLQSFDGWIGMFAEKITQFEIDVDTNSYRLATRFAKFHNLPELTALLSSIADFHQVDASAGIPELDGYSDKLIPRTNEFAEYLKTISERAEKVRAHKISRKKDNMLKITTDGRLAALDMRLVDGMANFSSQSKVNECADTVAEIYFMTETDRSAQLIFCDSSTPKDGFNIYDELKELLVRKGIPDEQIKYIHEATTEGKRNKLFKEVCEGNVRILIGSTFKLGLGVNVQDKLIALHHLDIPWRPADMTQREGRILRQGNTNEKVQIYRYITEGSFDAYSWQLLETKQRFITDLLSGSISVRSEQDVDETVLNYAEVKALAIGNPLIKERVETANELTRLITLQRKAREIRSQLEQEQLELPDKISAQEKRIADCEQDVAYYNVWKQEHPEPEDKDEKNKLLEERKMVREKIQNGLHGNILNDKDTVLMNYKGFDVILPAYMIQEKPYIYIAHMGRYSIELKDTAKGNLVRIDNFLDKLETYLEDLCKGLDQYRNRLSDIQRDLMNKKEDYADKISSISKKLEILDRKIGVIKS